MLAEEPPPIRLNPVTIEKVFTDCVMDLKRILVLDGIDILLGGFRVRSQDLHGPLPEIVIYNSGDTLKDKDRIDRETCKLIAISGLRDEIRRWFRGGRFLPATKMDSRVIVGFLAGRKTWIAEGDDFIATYHNLQEQVVG